MGHPHCLADVPFCVDRDEHREFLVSVASDKLFHVAATSNLDFGRSLCETHLQRFHSINIGGHRSSSALARAVLFPVIFT